LQIWIHLTQHGIFACYFNFYKNYDYEFEVLLYYHSDVQNLSV